MQVFSVSERFIPPFCSGLHGVWFAMAGNSARLVTRSLNTHFRFASMQWWMSTGVSCSLDGCTVSRLISCKSFHNKLLTRVNVLVMELHQQHQQQQQQQEQYQAIGAAVVAVPCLRLCCGRVFIPLIRIISVIIPFTELFVVYASANKCKYLHLSNKRSRVVHVAKCWLLMISVLHLYECNNNNNWFMVLTVI